MGYAYIPGLKILNYTKIIKKRILPISGKVVVNKSDKVQADTMVAIAEFPGKVHILNPVNSLGIIPSELKQYILKKEGDKIKKDEVIAENKPLIKWFKVKILSPIDGIVENISNITGQILLRELPQKLKLNAFVDGKIIEVIENSGVIIETFGTYIQGIFGIGKENIGELAIAVHSEHDVLDEDKILLEYKNKIIVGGSFITFAGLKKIQELGVKGIIVGGVDTKDLKNLLGYDIGIAITGTEDIDFTLILTEGFGKIPMLKKTFDLLKLSVGRKTSISGATQIRAGVIRPEIIICKEELENKEVYNLQKEGLKKGNLIRIIREPYFGKMGYVKSLPSELQEIETETKTRIVEIQLKNGERIFIPRANVEIIEE